MEGVENMGDDDVLDGCGPMDIEDKNTSDDDIAALALFADVDFEDPKVVAARKAEWETLGEAGVL